MGKRVSGGVRMGLLAVLILVAGACGISRQRGSDAAGPGGDLSGSIVVSGSSTVEPISALVAEQFQGANPDVSISVDGPGTGDGFELFCADETDVSNASRSIKSEEIAACEDSGVEFIELKVAIDGISVITSRENDDATCLDFNDLYALLGPESNGFESWSDANDLAQELGASNAPYPDIPLVITAPGEESGTYDSFTELVLEGVAEERGLPEEEWLPRPDYQSSPNDNVIITGVKDSDSSLGLVGYAFYRENEDKVKAFEVDAGDGCVAPSDEALSDGTYPISRDLYIYVNKARAEENPALEAFVDFYLSEEGLASVEDAGYVAQPPEEVESALTVWGALETGTRESQ